MNVMDVLDVQILKAVNEHQTMRTMAGLIGKNLYTVQKRCALLEKEGYIENPFVGTGRRQAAARKLTEKGKGILQQERLL